MNTLEFEDTDAFYEKLTDALKNGEKVILITTFLSINDVPNRLKSAFKLEEFKSAGWLNEVTGVFVAGGVSPAGLDYKPIVVLGSTLTGTAIGAGVGAAVGGVGAAPGAGFGALIGLVAGTIASAQMKGAHETQIEIDKDGKLKIHIKPKSV